MHPEQMPDAVARIIDIAAGNPDALRSGYSEDKNQRLFDWPIDWEHPHFKKPA